jgi:hypothetical protein
MGKVVAAAMILSGTAAFMIGWWVGYQAAGQRLAEAMSAAGGGLSDEALNKFLADLEER